MKIIWSEEFLYSDYVAFSLTFHVLEDLTKGGVSLFIQTINTKTQG